MTFGTQESTYASEGDSYDTQDVGTEDEVESIASSYSSRPLSPAKDASESEKQAPKMKRGHVRGLPEPVGPETVTLRGHKFEKVPQIEGVS